VIAAQLPGKALVVWQMVHHQSSLRGKAEVTLPAALPDRMGVERKTKVRALRCLEAAGLVTVAWQIGAKPLAPPPRASGQSTHRVFD